MYYAELKSGQILEFKTELQMYKTLYEKISTPVVAYGKADSAKFQIVKNLAKKEGCKMKGIHLLLQYYCDKLGWTMEQSLDYVISLFKDGTIKTIMLLGKGKAL
ncbi:MAG: hypothetical protein IJQ23_05510 [Clostridia bacterium]|nr:hypothetical protein [Clostridia bacterium]